MNAQAAKQLRMSAPERRAQIVEIATELFSMHGFERLTMGLLASKVGVTEPALYRYFDSKDALYEAVLGTLKDRIDIDGAVQNLSQAAHAQTLLYGMARFIVRNFSKHKELARLLLLCALEGHPLAKKTFKDLRLPFVNCLSERLAFFIERGEMAQVHPEITARCFVGMVMDCSLGTHLWRDMQGQVYDPEKVIDNNIPIYLKGLEL